MADALAWEAHRQFAQHGDQHLHAETSLVMGRLALERGELAAARIYMEQARHGATKLCRRPLQAETLALALELASLTGNPEEEQNVLHAMAIHPSRVDGVAVALARRARLHRDEEAFDNALREAPAKGYAGAAVRLELARLHLDANRPEKARRPLQEGLLLARDHGLEELMLYGRMLSGLLPPFESEPLVARCLAESWLEIYLGVLELDGLRRLRNGDRRGAEERFASLQLRAEELGLVPTAMRAAALLS